MIREAYSFDDLLLVPKEGILDSRKDADISSEIVIDYPVEVPIISANMPSVTGPEMAFAMHISGGMGALHRFCSTEDQIKMWDYSRQGIISIGLRDGMERTEALANRGAALFLLDVAHGHSEKVLDFIEGWKENYPELYLIAGNVATQEGTQALAYAGADAIKVGIGPGAACTTREVTGFGYPQLSAIMNCTKEKQYFNIRIIADGGIRNSGDIVKALAAGADSVMIGRLLAGCDEAPNPGEYYGNASKRINGHNAPEGISGIVQRTGSVTETIKKLAWGIRSGISYAGATNLQELRENAEWVRCSPQSMIESGVRV